MAEEAKDVITIETKQQEEIEVEGIKCVMRPNWNNNAELLYALNKLDDMKESPENANVFFKIPKLLFVNDEEVVKNIFAKYRTKDGNVPVEDFAGFVNKIFETVQNGKKS